MEITGKITGIKYKLFLTEELQKIDFNKFNINSAPTSCIINEGKNTLAISRWVSPKRTRSYPYERIYNTLNTSKKITVIPVVKDEGAAGDRDFLQWDTISLMSLLDIYVILAYYIKADKVKNKISNQQFDNQFVKQKIIEIKEFHSSALHWNINELKSNFHSILNKVISSYKKIEYETKVQLHGINGLQKFKDKIGKDVTLFMDFSRDKALKAQSREIITQQPKENLSSLTKSKITIKNYLGGNYFLTIDEISLSNDKIYLIEGKHTINSILPSKGDIKDGLLKMILFSNLIETKVDGKERKCYPILELTSSKLVGQINSQSTKKEISSFINNNNFNVRHKLIIQKIFEESISNNFMINIKNDRLKRL